jgi:hypothetical protein
LLATVISWEITKVQFVKTADSVFIPKALKLPFMLGTISEKGTKKRGKGDVVQNIHKLIYSGFKS